MITNGTATLDGLQALVECRVQLERADGLNLAGRITRAADLPADWMPPGRAIYGLTVQQDDGSERSVGLAPDTAWTITKTGCQNQSSDGGCPSCDRPLAHHCNSCGQCECDGH